MKLLATCAFGLEGLVKNTLRKINIWTEEISDGHVFFKGEIKDLIKANLSLRTAEKVFLILKSAPTNTFNELFDLIKSVEWENYFDSNAKILVNASRKNSKLYSIPTIQSISKRAIIKRFQEKFNLNQLPETGINAEIHIFIINDIAYLTLNSSGPALHKRGYRKSTGDAPIKESLAAAIVMLSNFEQTKKLIDPFCGSGSILIEAALLATNTPPGIFRNFAFNDWINFPQQTFQKIKEELIQKQNLNPLIKLDGYDIDESVVEKAKLNYAQTKLPSTLINFKTKAFQDLEFRNFAFSTIICNPPYGQRLEDNYQTKMLYREFGKKYQDAKASSLYFLTPIPELENLIELKAEKNRKLYNGTIKCYLYQFHKE